MLWFGCQVRERERYSCSKPKGEHSKLSHLSLVLYRIMLFGISFIVDFISLLWSATAMLYSRSLMWQMRISYKCRVGWHQKLKALLGSMCDRRPESVEILSCVKFMGINSIDRKSFLDGSMSLLRTNKRRSHHLYFQFKLHELHNHCYRSKRRYFMLTIMSPRMIG